VSTTTSRPRLRLTRAATLPLVWGLEHGVMKVVFDRQARAGDPMGLLERDLAVREHPEGAWEEIRAAGPLRRGKFVWQTAHHAVGSAVLRSDAVGVPVPGEQDRVGRLLSRLRDEWSLGPVDPPSLLAIDAPDHLRLRRLVSKAFTPRRVAGMADGIEATAHRLLDRLAGRRGFDLVEEYAAPLPLTVIADLLGVPEAERGPLLDWGNAGAALLDAGLAFSTYRRSIRATRELHGWFDRHLARLRRDPGDDLLSGVIAAADALPEAERPTPLELRMLGMLVLGAGFETTVNLLGNAVWLLSEHPDQRDALVAAPQGWDNAVEEVLRFDSPVQFTARTVRAPLDLSAVGGPTLRPGALVVMLMGAMHRDPAVFADPNTFDVTRANAADHLAFSAGPHFCLGAGLARVEARIGLRVLHERFPGLAVAGTPVRRETRVLRGYERLPVAG
jgi:cytochrome P450